MGNLENIICKYVTDTSIELSDNTNLMRDLELSSLDFADILCDIEDYYGIEVNEKDINNIMTIGEIKSIIDEYISYCDRGLVT